MDGNLLFSICNRVEEQVFQTWENIRISSPANRYKHTNWTYTSKETWLHRLLQIFLACSLILGWFSLWSNLFLNYRVWQTLKGYKIKNATGINWIPRTKYSKFNNVNPRTFKLFDLFKEVTGGKEIIISLMLSWVSTTNCHQRRILILMALPRADLC